MKNFLKDLKNFSEKENYVTKKILKTLDQESKSSKVLTPHIFKL